MTAKLVHSGLSIREKLRQVYNDLRNGRTDYVTSFCTEDCVFTILGNPLLNPYAGTWKGRHNIVRAHQAYFAELKPIDMLVEDMLTNDDKAMVHLHVTSEHVRSGMLIESERCDIISVRDGLAYNIKCFFNSEATAIQMATAPVNPQKH
ncbi:nuclear transport factor 2 family protein [Phreatobacter aquaticus]|uniref:Nuclear transport factor 2 family protein n=1 Tax=Phreatobacter aquaticus TaxID=2570229 RepID=A0A4D7QUU9_9HYPH|nr:nuclear transport factor 2 family protein [Phreatobacter aquaticus]QCK87742.1 nuclear transport factor 2 family protein [Phreatobacter aquaticus]